MTEIRHARPEDMPALAAIRYLSFRDTKHTTTDSLAEYLRFAFFSNPWASAAHPSYVFERGGKILGFLGVVPRPMRYRGRAITLGVISHFMVHPESRGQRVGATLMQHFLNGPQDMFLGDVSNSATRYVWLGSGGHLARLHCLYWRRALSPLRDASTHLATGALGRLAMRSARPLLGVVDSIATSAGISGAIPDPQGECVPLDMDVIAKRAPELVARDGIQPVYDGSSLRWLMTQLQMKTNLGTLEGAMVKDDQGTIVGWFIYFANPRGMSRVIQVASAPEHATTTLGHLIRAAWKRGSVTLEGRMEPHLFDELSAAGATFKREDPWVMVHSRDHELLAAMQNGDAFLTRIDSNWWMNA